MGKTTIDINGKRYDANSGELLGDSLNGGSSQIVHPSRQSRTVDGFVRPNKANTAVQQSNHLQLSAARKQPAKPLRAKHAQRASVAKTVVHHQPEKAKTLMRRTVKKPAVDMKPAIKTQAPSELAAAPKSAVATPVHKLSAHNVDERRLSRARTVQQSNHIKRFTPQPAVAETTPIQVQQAAQIKSTAINANTAQHAPAVRSHHQTPSRTRIAGDVRRAAVAPRTAAPQRASSHALFEAAVANARSHEQPAYKPIPSTKRRAAQVSAVFASVFLLIGFIAYINMSNIELRVASLQAGFHAALPAYKPTGYALKGGVHAANGVVSFRFSSGDSNYQIQQQASNWDSQTLLDNVVAMANTPHQTYQNSGRTVYVYDNGKSAAWVNAGVLYNMKVTGDLSSHQIVNVAASI